MRLVGGRPRGMMYYSVSGACANARECSRMWSSIRTWVISCAFTQWNVYIADRLYAIKLSSDIRFVTLV